jgi:hypothetical protein
MSKDGRYSIDAFMYEKRYGTAAYTDYLLENED